MSSGVILGICLVMFFCFVVFTSNFSKNKVLVKYSYRGKVKSKLCGLEKSNFGIVFRLNGQDYAQKINSENVRFELYHRGFFILFPQYVLCVDLAKEEEDLESQRIKKNFEMLKDVNRIQLRDIKKRIEDSKK
jgi:hypothetical protein